MATKLFYSIILNLTKREYSLMLARDVVVSDEVEY